MEMTTEVISETYGSVNPSDMTSVPYPWETGDEDREEANCEMYNFIITVMITGGLCLFGWVGNTLSFMVMWPDRNRSATSLTLLILAVIDNMVLVFRFMMKVLPALCQFRNKCPSITDYIDVRVSIVGWSLNSMAQQATTWNAVIMTVIRYISVCIPHRAKTLATIKTTRIACTLNLVAAIVFNIPRMFERKVIIDDEGKYVAVSTSLSRLPSFSVGYKQVAFYLVFYVIPLTILIVLTSRLIYALKKAAKKRQDMTQKAIDRQDITITLLAVVIVFIVCQLFTPVRRTIVYFLPREEQRCPFPYHYFNELNSTAIVFNSAINFILYCLFSRRFRSHLHQLLSCHKRVAPSAESTAQASQAPANTVNMSTMNGHHTHTSSVKLFKET